MRQSGSRDGSPATRRAWTAPRFTATAIRANAKLQDQGGQRAAQSPLSPAAPSSKLGFAFEMAFPLSARME
jgi:hypothetical protein